LEVTAQQFEKAAYPLRPIRPQRNNRRQFRHFALSRADAAGALDLRRRGKFVPERCKTVLQRNLADLWCVLIELLHLSDFLFDAILSGVRLATRCHDCSRCWAQPILSRNSSTASATRWLWRISATVRSGYATYQPSAVIWCLTR